MLLAWWFYRGHFSLPGFFSSDEPNSALLKAVEQRYAKEGIVSKSAASDGGSVNGGLSSGNGGAGSGLGGGARSDGGRSSAPAYPTVDGDRTFNAVQRTLQSVNEINKLNKLNSSLTQPTKNSNK